MFACIVLFIRRYDIVVSSSEWFIWIDLAHAHACYDWKQKSQSSLDDLFASEFLYHFYASVNFVMSQALLWRLLLSWLSLLSLLLAFTCIERECCSCFQITETKNFQRVHYKFLYMVFQTIHVNFHVLPLKLSNHFSFCEPVLAHEEVCWVILYSTCQTDLSLD